MSKPTVAGTQPVAVELKAGKSVWWCSCGRSKNHPSADRPSATEWSKPMTLGKFHSVEVPVLGEIGLTAE
jgi:hypothetical protein